MVFENPRLCVVSSLGGAHGGEGKKRTHEALHFGGW
jgi:hypothetical protein